MQQIPWRGFLLLTFGFCYKHQGLCGTGVDAQATPDTIVSVDLGNFFFIHIDGIHRTPVNT